MSHIHTNLGEIDQTASAFIVRLDTPTPCLLLHAHKKLSGLMQPGGHVEPNEYPWQAVLREIEEETGYEPGQLYVLQPRERIKELTDAVLHPVTVCQNTHKFPGIPDHRHTDSEYAFAVNGEPKGEPAKGESTDLRWLDVDQLAALGKADIIKNVQDIGRYVLETIVSKWELVPVNYFEA